MKTFNTQHLTSVCNILQYLGFLPIAYGMPISFWNIEMYDKWESKIPTFLGIPSIF